MRRIILAAAVAVAATATLGGCGRGNGNAAATGTTGGGLFGGATGADDGVQLIPDPAVGAAYGATGPRKCSTKKVPANGPPSPVTIAKYVICGGEGVSGSNLYLYDNVEVTAVAPGRPYNPNEDVNMSNIDINKPVYAIKGSLRGYQCSQVVQPGGYDGGPGYHKGSNCNRTTQPNASGLCFQDTFGDWSCSMLDVSAPVNAETLQPAP